MCGLLSDCWYPTQQNVAYELSAYAKHGLQTQSIHHGLPLRFDYRSRLSQAASALGKAAFESVPRDTRLLRGYKLGGLSGLM